MVGGWVNQIEPPRIQMDSEILEQIYQQALHEICEVPGCKLPMHLVFMGHKVCKVHWNEDWKSINLKKIFGIEEESELTIEYLKKKGLV